MDRQIRRLGVAFLVLFVALFAQVNYIQVFAADDLANNPANAKRQLIAEYDIDRGEIVATDRQTVLATSRKSSGELRYQRRYPEGPLYATVTGFYSVYSSTGLEAAYNDYLTGDAAELLPQTLADQVLGRPKRGGTVVATIDPDLQRAAGDALGDQEGGVVAIEPSTGYVRVLYSNPSYDPNELTAEDPDRVDAAWKRLTSDPDKPMLSRAISELYPPGSTFKTVTSAAALADGYGIDSTWPNPPELDLPQTTATIENFGGEICPGGSQITLLQALTVSCNVVFGQVGLKVGADKLAAQAHAFGFGPSAGSGETVPFDIPWQHGVFPDASYFADRLPAVAISAIGQDQVAANPMQMALVASAIANGGTERRPRLVEEIRDQDGRVVATFGPEEWGRPMSAGDASALTQMMISVVEHGTGTAARVSGITVAGKTGTAQHGTGGEPPHAWFMCFSPDLDLAVAVVVVNGGSLGSEATGGQVAAPIARAVLEAALS
jgi:peptidoglycan glycosyltransferase